MADVKSQESSPHEKPVEWRKVKGRDEPGKVINRESIEDVNCLALLFESTGEVCFYTAKRVTPCDENGDIEKPIDDLPVKA